MEVLDLELIGVVYFSFVEVSVIGLQKVSFEDEEINIGNQNLCCGEYGIMLGRGSRRDIG